jgi:hypothetical protein
MKMFQTNKSVLKMIKNIWILMIVLIIVTFLNSSLEVPFRCKLRALFYCVPINQTESKEQHPHPSEGEIVSVFELAGTYYGEAIGAEWI